MAAPTNPRVVEDFIEGRLVELHGRAAELVDEYWAHNTQAQRTRPIGEWGKYGVRARRRGLAISIDWSRIYFYGPKGARKPRSVYLPRGANFQYNPNVFRDAPEWEHQVIADLEPKFGAIRKETAALKALWLAHIAYKKVRGGDAES